MPPTNLNWALDQGPGTTPDVSICHSYALPCTQRRWLWGGGGGHFGGWGPHARPNPTQPPKGLRHFGFVWRAGQKNALLLSEWVKGYPTLGEGGLI